MKRPPRPSRPQGPPPRQKPGFTQAVIAVAVGVAAGLLGATLAAAGGMREGVPGLLLGGGICLGTMVVWRAFGGTLQDFKELFR